MDPKSTALSSTDTYIDVDGLRIRCRKIGTGPPLLLLHGWGGSIESVQTIIDALAKWFTLYAVDLPGHGKSDLPHSPWSTKDFTRCVLGAMDALSLQTTDIVAHSFGGRVAIQIAAFHPDRVRRLVLANSAGVIPPRNLKYRFRVRIAKIARFLGRFGGSLGEGLRAYVYRKVGSKDYVSAGPLRETFVRIVNDDLAPLMPSITHPTLLIWGRNDEATPVSSGLRMQKLLPSAELVVLENAGHFSYIDQKDQFALYARRFLRSQN